MNFDSLVKLTGAMPHFDLPLLVQAFDDPRASIRVQLSRWARQGKVIGLRRGFYTLAEPYRSAPASPAALANALYRPAYLSGLWALGFYDLIPERVHWLTSVTTRPPQRFENPFGLFDYRNIKQEAFFGYRTVRDGTVDILVADPEKALLDHWHLNEGEWTMERLEEMRYQNAERVDAERLRAYAARYRSPRLERAVERWTPVVIAAEKGTVTL
jgi:predicted transcriptional regulator of viral defense system